MKKLLSFLSALAVTGSSAASVASCGNDDGPIVLVPIPNNSTAYNKALGQDIVAALKDAGYTGKTIYSNEDTSAENQNLLTALGQYDVKGVIGAPTEADGSYTTYKTIADKNIPIFAVDRTLNKTDVLKGASFTDNAAGGAAAAQYMADVMANKEDVKKADGTAIDSFNNFWDKVASGQQKNINVVEMIGDPSTSSSIERHNGFVQLVDGKGDIPNEKRDMQTFTWDDLKTNNSLIGKTLSQINDADTVFSDLKVNYITDVYNWDENKAKTDFESLMTTNNELKTNGVDVVITHNDPPVQTIYQYLESVNKGLNDNYHTLMFGFDGFKSTFDSYIKDGKVTGTLVQDPVGMAKWAVNQFVKFINGEDIKYEAHPITPNVGLATTPDLAWINDKA